MARNTNASLVLQFIDTFIKENEISDTSIIHLLLDYDDMMLKDPMYYSLLAKGKIEEAFALPDVPSPWADELIRSMHRLGVSIDIYTTRVDTDRVRATGESITEKLKLKASLFNSYFSIRNEANRVIPVSDAITENTMPRDGRNVAVLYCAFESRRDAFVKSNLKEFCSSLHALELNLSG